MPPKALYEKKNHVFYVTINRPEVMNCVDSETAGLLTEAWKTFRDDDDAYVAVLTGAGDKSFCAGADLKQASQGWFPGEMSQDRFRVELQNLEGFLGYTLGVDIYKPMIAAVNGYCFAGGLEIACMCDIRIADRRAEFGILNRRWNIGLGDGGTQRLWRIVGLGRALELIITGRRIDVEEAERIGLVNEIVPEGQVIGAGHGAGRADLSATAGRHPQRQGGPHAWHRPAPGGGLSHRGGGLPHAGLAEGLAGRGRQRLHREAPSGVA